MSPKETEEYILKLEGAELSYPYGKELAVYSVNDRMFATIEAGKRPTRLSLRCDKKLAETLIERYEEVMPAYKLNKNKWIRVVLSGQLSTKEAEGLIDHSYQLVKAETD